MKSLRILLLVGLAVLPVVSSPRAFAGDTEFRGVVRAIESQYGAHRLHIPLLGFAMFFVRPEGVSGMKLAVLESFHAPADPDEASRVLEGVLGPGWYPFVRVRSHADGETTLIYASPAGGKLRMMVVSLESSEATVVEFKIGEGAIRRWLKEPGQETDNRPSHRRPRTED
jgi:hypothetical protein